ncbi:hypothetical protein [Oceanicola sp. 502str15]|uniref:hypothetical protein n=1 Tax=Oceanicola sp. 502str15 TaxID=2696061 RepID=UPI002095A0AE|nr:hypothetical protein [Oceanicola sp. 502str15]MCO6382392.1 hypothetical protein [Oceanicola sp. 502str15]
MAGRCAMVIRRRTLLTGAGAAFLAPLASACRTGHAGQSGAATAGPLPSARGNAKGTATMEQDGLTLQARIEARPDAGTLSLAYRITSAASGPAYVYDKLIVPKRGGGVEAKADRAYVYPLPDEGEVLVMKDVPPQPPGLSPASLVVPLMVRLAPGEALQGALDFALPLRPWREYVSNELAYPRQTTLDSLRLRIGYALPPQGAEETTFDHAGETAYNFRNPPGVLHRQASLEARFETPGLPVLLPE